MKPFRVFVGAPYVDAPHVRAIHERLSTFGVEPVSTWAEQARGVENLHALSVDEIRAATDHNTDQIKKADMFLLLGREAAGGECYAEFERAFWLGKRRVVAGRRILSSYSPDVILCADVEEAIEAIVGIASSARAAMAARASSA